MVWINKIAKFASYRVEVYGAQYRTFAIFGLINYPSAFLCELIFFDNSDSFGVRLCATLFCLILFLKDNWPEKLKKYLPLYWYSTIIVCIPMLASYMVLKDNMSLGWLMNFSVGIMMLILLTDSLASVVIEIIGLPLGLLLFIALGNTLPSIPNLNDVYLALYMFICIVVLGTIFSRNKEVYAHHLLKASEDMNEKLEKMVQERTLELEKALAFKTEFLNNVSHEVRTPMQGICGVSEGMMGNWNKLSDDKKFENLKLIEKNSKRIFSLLCNLLDLSKFEAGMMKPDFSQINLNESLEEIIDECKTLYFSEKETRFKFMHAKEADLIADGERISQVLRNIFFNAIKFSPKDSLITIKISSTKLISENDVSLPALKVSISDEGIGVPEDDLKNIFENYTQTDRGEKKSVGTGLGLPICKNIIELHGGKIWAENNKKKGATFHFVIPVTQPGYSSKLIKKQNINPILNLTALMIDDEDPCFISMEMMLMDSGCQLVRAKSGSEGLKYLKAHSKSIDIVFLDLMMPDMYGFDVLQTIKDDPKIANIPVIMQSGAPNDEEIKKCFDIGLSGYIRKPYQKKDVLAALNECIKQAK